MAELGFNNVGDADDTWSDGFIVVSGRYQMPEAGTLTQYDMRIGSSSPSVNVVVTPCIYNDNAGSIVAGTLFCTFADITILTTDANVWKSAGTPSASALLSGNWYWIGFLVKTQAGTSPTYRLAHPAAGRGTFWASGIGDTAPATFPSTSGSDTTREDSHYITYTPGGAGGKAGSGVMGA